MCLNYFNNHIQRISLNFWYLFVFRPLMDLNQFTLPPCYLCGYSIHPQKLAMSLCRPASSLLSLQQVMLIYTLLVS